MVSYRWYIFAINSFEKCSRNDVRLYWLKPSIAEFKTDGGIFSKFAHTYFSAYSFSISNKCPRQRPSKYWSLIFSENRIFLQKDAHACSSVKCKTESALAASSNGSPKESISRYPCAKKQFNSLTNCSLFFSGILLYLYK